MAVELLKESDPKKIEAWDQIHDKRKLYRCESCGAEWKCEYGENKFHRYHGDKLEEETKQCKTCKYNGQICRGKSCKEGRDLNGRLG